MSDFEKDRPKHGYKIRRTNAGNTIFSILENKNKLIAVLAFVLDESYKYNGSLITNQRRITEYAKKLRINSKVLYRHLKELVDLKILIKDNIGEYKVNTNVIDYLEKDANPK